MPRQHPASRGWRKRAVRVAMDVASPRTTALAMDVFAHMPMLAVPTATRFGGRPNWLVNRTCAGKGVTHRCSCVGASRLPPTLEGSMSRLLAAFLGFVSVLPLAYVAYSISHMASLQPGVRPPPMLFENVFSLHLAMMGLTTVLMFIYLVIAYRSPRVPNDKRTFWAVVLFMGNMFAFPVFWYLFVWRAKVSNERAL
jgi:hypothetical protein